MSVRWLIDQGPASRRTNKSPTVFAKIVTSCSRLVLSAQPTGVQPTGVQPTGVQLTGVQLTGVQPAGVQPTGVHQPRVIVLLN